MPTVTEEITDCRLDTSPPEDSIFLIRDDNALTAVHGSDVWAHNPFAPSWNKIEIDGQAWLDRMSGSDIWVPAAAENVARITAPAVEPRFASEPTAELVEERHNETDTGVLYIKVEILGQVMHLNIADAVELVDVVATALAGVTV